MTVTDVATADVPPTNKNFNVVGKSSEGNIEDYKVILPTKDNASFNPIITSDNNYSNNNFLNGFNSRSTPLIIHQTATFRPMTISPCIFHNGSRSTASDIICTSNTTSITKKAPKSESLSRHGKEVELPYETQMLLRTSESHLESHARTPLDDQVDTNFRLMKNASMQQEQIEFKYKLKKIKLDRYFVEKEACTKIQSIFRGYSTRKRVNSIRIALGMTLPKSSLNKEDTIQSTAEKDRRAVRAMGLSVPPDQVKNFYQDVSYELFRSAIKLGLAPIPGYTLHGNKFNNLRKFKSIEYDLAARIISRLVRGFLARRRFRRSVDAYVQKAQLDSARLLQKCYRSHLLQKAFERDRQEYIRLAAIVIQRIFRGHSIRRKMLMLKAEKARLKREDTAAKTLQAIYRGKLFRRKLQEDLSNLFVSEQSFDHEEGGIRQPRLNTVVQMAKLVVLDQENKFDGQKKRNVDDLWQNEKEEGATDEKIKENALGSSPINAIPEGA